MPMVSSLIPRIKDWVSSVFVDNISKKPIKLKTTPINIIKISIFLILCKYSIFLCKYSIFLLPKQIIDGFIINKDRLYVGNN